MDRGATGWGVGPPGLLPAPVVPRRLAVPSRFAGSYLGRAVTPFPSRRRVRSLTSPRYGRVCARTHPFHHVSRTSRPRLRLLLHQMLLFAPITRFLITN